MKIKLSLFGIKNLCVCFLFITVSFVVHAQEVENPETYPKAPAEEILNLVQNANPKSTPPPVSGTILLPDSLMSTPAEEKKCMTVCARWGEDCTYINRGTGGMTRSCRRTCQQFTEECF